jgi:SAM-dependent methyltransferase
MKKFSNKFKNFSGDKKLNLYQKIIWLLISFININFNGKIDKKITIKKFYINPKLITKNNLFKSKSPIRLICNTFWQNLNWQLIKKKLNNNLKILEIGCGDGRYYDLIKKISKINKLKYTGIDIKNKFFKKNNYKIFFKDNANNVNTYLKKTNFLFTQSAIEHFKYDVVFFNKISNYLNKSKKKFMQIHLFPAKSCFYTYLFHGYRHYNFKMISLLTKSFNNKHKFFLFSIGSTNINKFTFKEITLRRILKKKIPNINVKKLKQCVVKDNKILSFNDTSFYCLVILTNLQIKDFLKK